MNKTRTEKVVNESTADGKVAFGDESVYTELQWEDDCFPHLNRHIMRQTFLLTESLLVGL